MKFITNYQTTSEFAAVSGDTDVIGRPHVSLTKDDYEVHFIKSPGNVIRYTATAKIAIDDSDFSQNLVSHTFADGVGVITFDGPLTKIPGYSLHNNSALKSIIIPKGVTYIGTYSLDNCVNLSSVTIPNTVTEIDSGAFDGDHSLTSLNLPNSLTTIGGYAFHECSGLTSLVLPYSVTEIYQCAFWYCTGLNSITCYAQVPPQLLVAQGSSQSNWFAYTNNCPMYVPAEAVDVYKQPYKWQIYMDRIYPITN